MLLVDTSVCGKFFSDRVTAGTGSPDNILRRELGQIGDLVLPEVLKIFAMTPCDRETRTRSIRWS